MSYRLFVHSPTEGHLGFFQVLAISLLGIVTFLKIFKIASLKCSISPISVVPRIVFDSYFSYGWAILFQIFVETMDINMVALEIRFSLGFAICHLLI